MGLGQAEVGYLYVAVLAYENIRRLDITMYNALLMGVFDSPADFIDECEGDFMGYEFRRVDELFQTLAIDILHGDVIDAFSFAITNDIDDILMLEIRRGPCLPFKPGNEILILGKVAMQYLDGYGPAGRDLLGLINGRHTARGDKFFDFIVFNRTVYHFSNAIIQIFRI